MSSAYYIVLEREIAGLENMMDGKNLSRSIASLDKAARELGVRPLSDFCSMPPEELADLLDAAADMVVPPPLQQFAARDGLATLRVLLSRPEARSAIQDLKDCERILNVAAEHAVGWHFQVDI